MRDTLKIGLKTIKFIYKYFKPLGGNEMPSECCVLSANVNNNIKNMKWYEEETLSLGSVKLTNERN